MAVDNIINDGMRGNFIPGRNFAHERHMTS